MVSLRVNELASQAYNAWLREDSTIDEMRTGFDGMRPDPPADVTVAEAELGGVAGRWVEAPEVGDTVIVHFHAGGFVMGSSKSHRGLAASISRAARARVFLPDYALAPEHSFPAPVTDGVAVYRALVDSGVAPERVVVSGDSVGGGLALATVLKLREEDLPMPGAIFVLSPWADLALKSDSLDLKEDHDPIATRGNFEQMSATYLQGHDAEDPIASPIYGDFAGFPPMLVQVGTSELLMDDAIRVADRARAAGVQVDLQIGYEMCHIFQMFAEELPEARRAIEEIGAFVQRTVGDADAAPAGTRAT